MDDYSGDSQGSSTGSKVLKFAAIGCGVVVLIGAVLAAFGAFKAVSCCGEFQQLALVAEEAQEHAYGFVVDLKRQDYESAYQGLDVQARQELQVEDLQRAFTPHAEALQRGMPTPFGVTLRSRDDEHTHVVWEMTTRVAEASSQEALQISLELTYRAAEGEDAQFGVSAWEVGRVVRSLADEPTAMMAGRFHREVTNGRLEDARRFVDAEAELFGATPEEFATHVATLDGLGITPAGVVAVAPQDAKSALVTLRVPRGEGAIDVVYEVSNTGGILGFDGPHQVSAAALQAAPADEATADEATAGEPGDIEELPAQAPGDEMVPEAGGDDASEQGAKDRTD